MKRLDDIIYSAVSTLLRPLVRILLRHNVPLATFFDLAKRVYVEVAMKEFPLPNRKQSVSRVALLTGLSRKEVLRVSRLAPVIDSSLAEQHNRSTRVVSGWTRDDRFGLAGSTAPLNFEGPDSFAELVRLYSGDITPRAVLDELLRSGLVQRLEDGRLQLVAPAYLPQGEAEKLHILGSDTADLIGTIDHNLNPGPETEPFFQRKVCYTRFPAQHLPELRGMSREKAQRLLEELDRWMAERDQEDPAPDDNQQHRRAGLSIYYFESVLQEGEDHETDG